MVDGKPMPVKKGDLIPDNAIVRTGQTDSLDIYFDDTARVISLGPNSQMRIELPTRSVVLDRGQVLGSVRKKSSDNAPGISVKTPTGVTSVARGDFQVNTHEQEVSVLSGSATYQSVTAPALPPVQVSAGKTLLEMSAAKPVLAATTQEASAQLMRKIDRVASAEVSMPVEAKAAAGGGKLTSPEPQVNPGTGTPGYWKNHSSAWPVSSITIGNVTYTKAQAIANLDTTKSDRTYTMFQDLVSAMLNVKIGNDSSCIASTIAAANAWITQYPLGSNVAGGSAAWTQGDPLHQTLDQYNNGLLCAPHRN